MSPGRTLVIYFRHSADRLGAELLVASPQARSIRELENLRNAQVPVTEGEPEAEHDLIFRSGAGLPLRQMTVKRQFRRLLPAAGNLAADASAPSLFAATVKLPAPIFSPFSSFLDTFLSCCQTRAAMPLKILPLRHATKVRRRWQRGSVRLCEMERVWWAARVHLRSGWESAIIIVK